MFPLYSYVDPNRYRLSSDDVRDIQSSLRRAIKALTYVISLYHRARHLCPQFEARWSRDNWRKIFSFQDGVFWWMFPELSSHLRYWSQESCSSFWGWQVLTDLKPQPDSQEHTSTGLSHSVKRLLLLLIHWFTRHPSLWMSNIELRYWGKREDNSWTSLFCSDSWDISRNWT